MATLVHAATATNHVVDSNKVPLRSFEEVERLGRLLLIAEARGYRGAVMSLGNRLHTRLDSIQRELDEAIFEASSKPKAATTSMREIFDDLTALQSEYSDFNLDFGEQTISVTTEPIELEDTLLGAFEIVLEVKYLPQVQSYRIEAADPSPASTCDATTHPHVQGENLCEGEAHLPIKLALAQGRLFDFFAIVNQTMHTYNEHSAYISLSDWAGAECRDCGETVSDDDISSCSRCDSPICGGCTCSCNSCDDVYCGDCTTMCSGCQGVFCGSCISSCDRCEQPFCRDCLTENQCDDCTEPENETEADPLMPPVPAVHALCLGETDLST